MQVKELTVNTHDLEVLNHVPFFAWAKDEEGRYVWTNQALNQFAGEQIAGKKDSEVPWSDDAPRLREADQQVLATGQPIFHHETVEFPSKGTLKLNVCKFLGEFEGKRCVFGVSFIID